MLASRPRSSSRAKLGSFFAVSPSPLIGIRARLQACHNHLQQDRFTPNFWLESSAVVAFAVAWLTKGETILKTNKGEHPFFANEAYEFHDDVRKPGREARLPGQRVPFPFNNLPPYNAPQRHSTRILPISLGYGCVITYPCNNITPVTDPRHTCSSSHAQGESQVHDRSKLRAALAPRC